MVIEKSQDVHLCKVQTNIEHNKINSIEDKTMIWCHTDNTASAELNILQAEALMEALCNGTKTEQFARLYIELDELIFAFSLSLLKC